MDLNSVAASVPEALGIKVEDVWAKGRYRRIAEANFPTAYRSINFGDIEFCLD